mmetsp:Transcript_138023/g.440897  ORF Transcript_138023/g.440897 Transcript_138023/m.440897 type:complete len:86 (-) Transcript_138023:143-400(-)
MSRQNLALLRSEMNLSLLQSFLATNQQKLEESRGAAGEEPADAGFSGRFPTALWAEAVRFFGEEEASEDASPLESPRPQGRSASE